MNFCDPIKPRPFVPQGLATGIGSMPFECPAEALALVMEETPEAPHWPQLPLKNRQEHFVHQFLHPLVACGMLVCRAQRWSFDMSRENNTECLTRFYSQCLPAEDGSPEGMQSFLPPPEAAAGFHAFLRLPPDRLQKARYVKGQVAGPLTIALELKDEFGRPAYYQGDLRDTIVRTLALNARYQAEALLRFGLTPLMFVDDPAISAYGSRLHLALNRNDILEDLNFICAAIRSAGALPGIHSCEAVDWSLVMESKAQILSLDAYRFGASLIPYADQLKPFLDRGGVVAWGIVPTVDDPFGESADSLFERLQVLWDNLFAKGPDRETVLRQSMVTPACGTGLLTVDQARRIYRLTAEVSRRIREASTDCR